MFKKLLSILVLLVICVISTVSVYAQDPEEKPNTQGYCVVNVEKEGEAKTDEAKQMDEICFKTSLEASRFLRAGYTVVGISYDNRWWTGSVWIFTTPHTPGCSDGSSFRQSASGGASWDDRIESSQVYGGCVTCWHFDSPYYNCPCYPCIRDCYTLYSMNNATSSMSWH